LAAFTLVTPVNMDEEDLITFDAQPRPDGLGGLRLPTFWVDKPASWFITAESRFRLHGINQEQTRYDFLVAALSKEAVSLVLDIVENPPGHHPYSALKERLLELHQLNDYQRVVLLLRMEQLGGRKPSELLAAMLEICPRGHESSIFFTHLFLERLPAELRIMLGEDNHQTLRDVAKKADSLWALHKMHLAPVLRWPPSLVPLLRMASSPLRLWPLRGPQRWRPSPPVAQAAVAGDRAVVDEAAVALGFQDRPGVVPRSRLVVSRWPASLQPPLLSVRRIWPGYSTGSASTTSILGSRLTTALPPATGETSLPGVSQRRSSRPAGSYHGPAYSEAFPGRHRSCLFSISPLFTQLSERPGYYRRGWSAYTLLGRKAVSSLLRRSSFHLAVPACRCPVPHHWGGFFEIFWPSGGPGC
jgi:hypothetical protein